MSNRFESTKLWQSTLAPQLSADPDHDLRRQLRTAFELFRERAALLARQIERDLPDFTVHDITHIDALWEMAETITDGKYELTPSEAFVLGGAFLVHDLGMSVAAIPGGVAAIQQEQVYRDTIASHLKKQLGRVPSQEEQTNAAAEVRQIATGHTLRTLHAKYAEQLALATWTDDHGRESHLIEDPELRQTYGRLIGIIAHSHWWPIDKVLTKMPARTGAPGGYPSSWTVDPIKLACLLRVADAAHLDSRRAPAFVRALRRPTGDAIPHWDFQEKLYQPRLEAGRLVYTCKERFPEAQAPAWWACYDALRVVDRELRDVDAALAAADGKLPRLAATGVANTEEPWRLTQLIEVDGWQPVDTQLRVTAVGALVKTLGGEALYGNDSTAPLRELIQNASDAVRARRVIEKESPQWGSVIVRTGADELGEWLEVEDTGIGMSPTVLCGPLLDFGNSFWGSKLMHDELPGLEAAGFSSTGRFGIGFFAVFMLGDHVTVTSRRYEAGHDETWVLDFKQGVEDRPLLRKARANEVMKKGGTRIRVRLNEEYRLENLSGRDFQGNTPDFALTLAGLCPALDVDLYLQQSAKMVEKLVTANDWVEMPIFDLLSRIADGAKREDFSEELETYLPLFEVIRNEAGIPIGRVCIIPDQDRYNFSNGKRGGYMIGAVTVGGFYTSALSELCGVLVGVTSRAARDECSPIASLEQIRPFATRQALTLARARSDNSYTLSNCASAVLALGGDARPLPIAECVDGYLRFNDIVARFSSLENNEVVIADYHIFLQYSSKKKAIVFMANVLFLETDRTIFVHHGRGTFSQDGWPWPEQAMDDKFHTWSCYRLCVEALAQSWNVSAKDLYAARESYQTRSDKGVLIGMVGKKKIMEELVSVFRRPK